MIQGNRLYSDMKNVYADIQYIHASKNIDTLVTAPGTWDLPKPLFLQREFKLIGQNTTLRFDLNDGSINAIELVRRNKEAYIYENTIQGIDIEVVSPCYAIIATNRSRDTIVKNCNLRGNDLAKRGVSVGTYEERGAIKSSIVNCGIHSFLDAGIYYEDAGNLHTIKDMSSSSRSFRGVAGVVSSLSIDNTNIERSDKWSIDLEVRQFLHLNRVYFENTNIRLKGEGMLRAILTKFSGGDIDLKGLFNAYFSQCRLRSIRDFEGANQNEFHFCNLGDRIKDYLTNQDNVKLT